MTPSHHTNLGLESNEEKSLPISILALPGVSVGKESACNAEDLGLMPGLGRSPGEGNGNPHQSSCLENSMERGAWWATVYGVAESWA